MKNYYLLLAFFLGLMSTQAQTNTKNVSGIEVSNTKLVKLGHSQSVRSLTKKHRTSDIKRQNNRNFKKVPDNFKGRRGVSKSVHSALEHQGLDPLRQSNFSMGSNEIKPFVNVDGIGDFGSPHDPSGDVSDKFYVQMINATLVGVFDLEGNLLEEFAANTLWTEFDQSSEGDPIVLYDENVDRWILTEFADPSNVLIAISDDGDPLGEYSAYNFSTPNFPDYPKYALSPNILTFTSNEEGAGEVHQYFIDLQAMYSGAEEVNMQRVRLPGNITTEASFYVTTPVDWNGTNQPFDERPIVLILNDSSWDGGPAQDQVELYTFDIDFFNEDSTFVMQTSIPTTPFDSYPCSESGVGFACVPQQDGDGLDAIPEVIMNLPHLRNFGNHESMVFSFVTDVTDGDNLSGIRWVELRRTNAIDEWTLFQEGTFAPDDGKDRFMPSIAMDAKGNIGLAYNISSLETFVGARFTGRTAGDPLGVMTVNEVTIVEGRAPINSSERFGDYSQMSVSPKGDNAFWWTSEYAGAGEFVTQTRIVAFRINRDTFDLALREILNPRTSADLTTTERVTVMIRNSGLESMSDYEVKLLYRNEAIETLLIPDTILPDSSLLVTFQAELDLSQVDQYEIAAVVSAVKDQNSLNDTLRVVVRQLFPLDAGISGQITQGSCTEFTMGSIILTNNGANPIDSVEFTVEVNGLIFDTVSYSGSVSFDQSSEVHFEVGGLKEGNNSIKYSILSVNNSTNDAISENNIVELTASKLAEDQFITLEFTTDEYPEESQWELFAAGSGELIASGGFLEGEQTTRQNICANTDSCFVFILTDAFSDGICCDFGDGHFNIFDNEGILLASSNGNFGDAEIRTFCGKGIACTLELETSTIDASAEGSADGIILLEVSGGVDPYQFSIDGGQTFQDSSTFVNVAPGIYKILVKDDSGSCEKTDSARVGFTSGVIDIEGYLAEVILSPNPTYDIFKIIIKDLKINDPQLNIEIIDLSGRLIQERKISNYSGAFIATFSLMDYAAGSYIVRIRHKKFNYLEKIVKISR